MKNFQQQDTNGPITKMNGSKRVPIQKGPLVDPNSLKSNQRNICFPLGILAWQGDGNPSQNFRPGEGRFRVFSEKLGHLPRTSSSRYF